MGLKQIEDLVPWYNFKGDILNLITNGLPVLWLQMGTRSVHGPQTLRNDLRRTRNCTTHLKRSTRMSLLNLPFEIQLVNS